MHGSRLHEDHVTLLRTDNVESLGYSAVMTSVIQFLCSHLTVESGINLSIWTSLEHIPDLVLAQSVISFSSNLIIRMDLHGKLAVDVKKLYKKRELSTVIVIYVLSDNTLKVGLHDLADRISGQPAIRHDRILKTHIGYLPALSHLLISTNRHLVTFLITLYKGLSKPGHKCISAPRSSGGNRYKS